MSDRCQLKKRILRALDEFPGGVRVFAHDILISLRLRHGDIRTVRQREIADCLLELIDEGLVRMIHDDLLSDGPSFELAEKLSTGYPQPEKFSS